MDTPSNNQQEVRNEEKSDKQPEEASREQADNEGDQSKEQNKDHTGDTQEVTADDNSNSTPREDKDKDTNNETTEQPTGDEETNKETSDTTQDENQKNDTQKESLEPSDSASDNVSSKQQNTAQDHAETKTDNEVADEETQGYDKEVGKDDVPDQVEDSSNTTKKEPEEKNVPEDSQYKPTDTAKIPTPAYDRPYSKMSNFEFFNSLQDGKLKLIQETREWREVYRTPIRELEIRDIINGRPSFRNMGLRREEQDAARDVVQEQTTNWSSKNWEQLVDFVFDDIENMKTQHENSVQKEN